MFKLMVQDVFTFICGPKSDTSVLDVLQWDHVLAHWDVTYWRLENCFEIWHCGRHHLVCFQSQEVSIFGREHEDCCEFSCAWFWLLILSSSHVMSVVWHVTLESVISHIWKRTASGHWANGVISSSFDTSMGLGQFLRWIQIYMFYILYALSAVSVPMQQCINNSPILWKRVVA